MKTNFNKKMMELFASGFKASNFSDSHLNLVHFSVRDSPGNILNSSNMTVNLLHFRFLLILMVPVVSAFSLDARAA